MSAWQLHAPEVRKANVASELDDRARLTAEAAVEPDAGTAEPGPGLEDGVRDQMAAGIAAAHDLAKLLPGKAPVDVTLDGQARDDQLRVVITISRPTSS